MVQKQAHIRAHVSASIRNLGLRTFYKPNCSVGNREVHAPASSGQHPRLLLHSTEVSTLTVMNTLGAYDNTVTDCGDTHHHREPLDITGSECLHQLVGTESSVVTYIVLQSFGRHKHICNILMFLAVQ